MHDDRYQFQPWTIRLCRWLRHMPIAWLCFALWYVRWRLSGRKTTALMYPFVFSRNEHVESAWERYSSRALERMGHVYTIKEVRAELRKAA